jgi:hypothetical protein
VVARSKEQNDAVMDELTAVEAKVKTRGRLGPTARLTPTSTGTRLRKRVDPPLVIDGLLADTKEQLLGFFVIECVDLDRALETAKEIGQTNPDGSYEIRPMMLLRDNKLGTT